MNAATQRPPWETTPEQDTAIEAAKARLTAERVPAPPFACEGHAEPGSCTRECASDVNMMMGDAHWDDRPYDPTGCSNPPPRPEQRAVFVPEAASTVLVTEHPEDCTCGKPECPPVIAEDAFYAVVGEERRTERWVKYGFDGPWQREA
jgi:hypothetical protein